MPKVSVITVCYNAQAIIEGTINSVLSQDYPALEFIVIDGNSSDGTVGLVQRYLDKISTFISEPDKGVYDAMNKGIHAATGDYLLFMNAGDFFFSAASLKEALALSSADVIYGDFNYLSGPRQGRVVADFPHGVFNHQSVLYKRELHAVHGEYVSVKGLTAADYLFFMSVQASTRGVSFEKVDVVIANVDAFGMSAGPQTFLQVGMIDGLLQRRSRYPTALRIAIHPLFNRLRNLLRRLR